MHPSARELGRRFFEIYRKDAPGRILDVGSRDVNGTLRPYVPPGTEYIGIDLEGGTGVDIVLNDPYSYPFPEKFFDWVISTSTFEHDKFFWVTFAEMCRVLSDGGLIYLNAPSNGSYHGYPQDYWRFYPDAALALEDWGQRMHYPIYLVESFIAPQFGSEWNDCVMIFARDQGFRPSSYLSDHVEFAHNIHRGREKVRNVRVRTQDQEFIAHYRQKFEPSRG
jgi:SAM-dependent methyltransferase